MQAEEEMQVFSIYVKNLSFGTTEEGLQRLFDTKVSALGGHVRAVRVAKRGDGGKKLSAGYGFVEVDSGETA